MITTFHLNGRWFARNEDGGFVYFGEGKTVDEAIFNCGQPTIDK